MSFGGATKRLPLVGREALRPVSIASNDLTVEHPLSADEPLPLVIEAKESRLALAAWALARRERLMEQLVEHGGILFRGFDVGSPEVFGDVAASLTPNLLDYIERAAVRDEVAPKVFTSTELACDQRIPLHHEMSYSHNWPWRIYFYCDTPAESRGETPVAGERRFFSRLDPAIKQRFIDRKVMYVRNFGPGLDVSWKDAFQTDNRAEVEAYCRRSKVSWEWGEDDRLRTRQVRQAIARHPTTGETVWFNHAHLFHQSNLPDDLLEVLLSTFGREGLPRNAYYGDGSPIEASILDEIRHLYQACSVSFPWRRGDVLLLDNFLTVHGREPYGGNRRVLVAMADLCVNEEFTG